MFFKLLFYVHKNKTNKYSICIGPKPRCKDLTYQKYDCSGPSDTPCKCVNNDYDYCKDTKKEDNECFKAEKVCENIPYSVNMTDPSKETYNCLDKPANSKFDQDNNKYTCEKGYKNTGENGEVKCESCKDGFYNKTGGGKSVECVEVPKNAKCEESKCECIKGFYSKKDDTVDCAAIPDNAECDKEKGCLQSDLKCKKDFYNKADEGKPVECVKELEVENAICEKSKCECNKGFYSKKSDPVKCVDIPENVKCSKETGCLQSDLECEAGLYNKAAEGKPVKCVEVPNAKCEQSKCECNKGFYSKKGKTNPIKCVDIPDNAKCDKETGCSQSDLKCKAGFYNKASEGKLVECVAHPDNASCEESCKFDCGKTCNCKDGFSQSSKANEALVCAKQKKCSQNGEEVCGTSHELTQCWLSKNHLERICIHKDLDCNGLAKTEFEKCKCKKDDSMKTMEMIQKGNIEQGCKCKSGFIDLNGTCKEDICFGKKDLEKLNKQCANSTMKCLDGFTFKPEGEQKIEDDAAKCTDIFKEISHKTFFIPIYIFKNICLKSALIIGV